MDRVRATRCCLRVQRYHFIVLAEVIVLLTQAMLDSAPRKNRSRYFATMSKVKIGMQHIGGKKKEIVYCKKFYFLKKDMKCLRISIFLLVVIDYIGVDSESQPQCSLFF